MFRVISFLILILSIFSCQVEASDSRETEIETESPVTFAKYLHISPNGSDKGSGTLDSPFKTISRGIYSLRTGECLYIHKGTYYPDSTIIINKSGRENAIYGLMAYPGDEVILDFSNVTASETYGIQLKNSYWHLKGIIIQNVEKNALRVTGSNNIIENCVTRYNGDTGIHLTIGSNNLFLNCDSYRNYDPENHGQDADGFAAKLELGEGNRFKGCRSWNNSDDGWDLWESTNPVVIEECWAFENGIDFWNDDLFEGNGNGFKLGGSNKEEPYHYNLADHRVINCVAFGNTNKGFDQNNNLGIQTLINNTAWNNDNYNYGFWRIALNGENILTNNISLNGRVRTESPVAATTNSWQGFIVTQDDFITLDYTLATADRESDGSLPDNNLARLSEKSKLIDAGSNTGKNYKGVAPDLGAYESDY